MRICILFSLLLTACWCKAQQIYGSNFTSIFTADLATCQQTILLNGTPPLNDMCISPSGLFYGIASQDIVSINPSTGAVTTVSATATPGNIATSLEWGEDGFLYALGNQVWRINPTTGVSVSTGSLPAGWVAHGDLVYLNGIYYATAGTFPTNSLINVNLNNPGASTIVSTLPTNNLYVAGASVNHPTCPKLYWATSTTPSVIWEYDVSSNTWSQKCPNFGAAFGGGDTQNNYTFPFVCPCTVNAGNVTQQAFNLCGSTTTATVPYTGGAQLGSVNILRYILFSDLANPSGTIIAQSASPVFTFLPSMQLGIPYYLGTVAGPEINGNVNLAASCIDFSNQFATVTWRALPSVTYTAVIQNVCPGECITFEAVLTGVPPFTLNYAITGGTPNSVTLTNSPSDLIICTTPLAIAGPYSLSTLNLSDAFCTCGP